MNGDVKIEFGDMQFVASGSWKVVRPKRPDYWDEQIRIEKVVEEKTYTLTLTHEAASNLVSALNAILGVC